MKSLASLDMPEIGRPMPFAGRDQAVLLGGRNDLFFGNGRLRRIVAGGAFQTNGGLYIVNWKKPFDGSDLVIDWVNDSCKIALYTNSIAAMSYSTDTGIGAAPYTANEVTGTGYTAGGVVLASKTVTESPTGTLMFDAADASWTSSTFANARGAVVWDDTLVTPTDPVLCAIPFGADFGVTAGTFTIQFASAGLWNIDITP